MNKDRKSYQNLVIKSPGEIKKDVLKKLAIGGKVTLKRKDKKLDEIDEDEDIFGFHNNKNIDEDK